VPACALKTLESSSADETAQYNELFFIFVTYLGVKINPLCKGIEYTTNIMLTINYLQHKINSLFKFHTLVSISGTFI